MMAQSTDRRNTGTLFDDFQNEKRKPEGNPKACGVKKVFICSPFRPSGGSSEEREKDRKKNIALAKEACRYAVRKGFIPYAPHLYFPGFLSDEDPDERELGILLGLSWLVGCDEVWIVGVKISKGMSREIAMAMEWRIPIKSYLPLAHRAERLFDVEFCTEDEFFKKF